MKDFTKKISSGSSRDKTQATPKRGARGYSNVTHLFNHKVDSIRESVSLDSRSILKGMLSAISSFFSRVFRRKVI